MQENNILAALPAVFAVGKEYQISVLISCEALMWVKVGDECYYDASNGILRSRSRLHKMSVPMDKLDAEKKYVICYRKIIERKPYFTETEEIVEVPFEFTPVSGETIRAYHIADAHNRIAEPVTAAKTFGELDLLILNGDVIDHSGDPSKFSNVYEICSLLTGGSIPTVFSRGNHDMRGRYAEKFAEYTPNRDGYTYYSFHLGSIWGLLMDCGEDKPDTNPEYGFTVACHAFREKQTAYIEKLVSDAENEYNAEGVKTRLVIAHNPFTQKHEPPFDIEEDIYRKWCVLLREEIRPQLMICGHMHQLQVRYPGCEEDTYGQACPVVIGAVPKENYFAGCGYIFKEDGAEVVFTDSTGACLKTEFIAY